MFEVWDIPWQGTSTLLKQKCQPKGQLPTYKQPFNRDRFIADVPESKKNQTDVVKAQTVVPLLLYLALIL